MNMLDAILSAQNGAAVRQIGTQLGLGEGQTIAALGVLVPALAAGVRQNTRNSGGLDSLIAALSSGTHARYVDNPATLSDPATVADGNGILGHVFGSKEVSRGVAGQAAAQTGISADVLRRMLPLVATLVMGTLAHQQAPQAGARASVPGGAGLLGMLGATLDQNRDGSIVDDVTRLLGSALRR
jgi:hypothetical protein